MARETANPSLYCVLMEVGIWAKAMRVIAQKAQSGKASLDVIES